MMKVNEKKKSNEKIIIKNIKNLNIKKLLGIIIK